MSNIILSHESALLWLKDNRDFLLGINCKTNKVPKSLKIDNTLKEKLAKYRDSYGKTHIIVGKQSVKHNIKNFQVHSMSALNSKHFISITDNFSVCIPELVFLQMSTQMTPEKLMLTGLDMCAKFSVMDGQLESCNPLTNPDKIMKFCKDVSKKKIKINGVQNATHYASKITGSSASPAETESFMKLCAPRQIGGYGVKNMRLNFTIKLSNVAASINGNQYITPDICNPKTKTAVEYQSEMFHDNTHQNRRDNLRYDALTYDGWKVFNIVDVQLKNLQSFDSVARMILKANKQDPNIRCRDFILYRYKLWQLFKN